MRYYYKDTKGNYYSLKSPKWHELVVKEEYLEGEEPDTYSEEELELQKEFTEITEEEFNALQPQPHVPTEQELERARKQRQMAELKQQLASTDYKCLKFIDGEITAEEYEPIKQERARLREQIRELEGE